MASIASMISLIVLLLATYSYSAPVVPDLQNATSTMQVENATIDFRLENLVILARRDASDVDEEKRGNETVGLSSSSSEDESVQTNDQPSSREFEDASFPSSSETNAKRDVDTEVNQSFDDNNNNNNERSFTEVNNKRDADAQSLDDNNNNERSFTEVNNKRDADTQSLDDNEQERSFTEESLSTEVNNKRDADAQSFDDEEKERSFSEENTKRGIEVESFESSTVDETSVAPSSQIKNVKRSLDGGQWLADESNSEIQKRSYEEVQSSTDAVEETSVPSTSEVTNTKRGLEQSSSLSDETSDEFNRRAIGSVEVDESSTIRAVRILSESTTDEQPSSSTDEVSSTTEYETTVAPVDESTSVSPVSGERQSKILAIIPGQISRTQLVIDPATGTTAGFRPMKQVQLRQGQNQTITEERKPYY